MEHTHLVKGLDYSLLHKVRSEIAMREQKNDEALESQYNVSGFYNFGTVSLAVQCLVERIHYDLRYCFCFTGRSKK